MEPKSQQLIVNLPLKLIDRWPPSVAYRNSLLGCGFSLETNARVRCVSVHREWWLLQEVTLGCSKTLPVNQF